MCRTLYCWPHAWKPTQLFLFASTSAVTEGSGDHAATEVHEVLVSKLDAYARSMHEREQALSELSRTSEAPQLIGMRFGTVIGNSAGQPAVRAAPTHPPASMQGQRPRSENKKQLRARMSRQGNSA